MTFYCHLWTLPPTERTKWYQTLLISELPHCFSPLPPVSPTWNAVGFARVTIPVLAVPPQLSSPCVYQPPEISNYILSRNVFKAESADGIDKMSSVTLTGQQHFASQVSRKIWKPPNITGLQLQIKIKINYGQEWLWWNSYLKLQ